MSDLIDRQAAINALENDKATLDNIIRGMSANDVRLDAYVSQRNQVNYDIDTINNLPSAQPEQLGTNLAEGGTDCISRQTAIDAIDEISREVDDGYGFDYAKWRQYFCELPSEHGTNLAEVGTDCISRQAAIDALHMHLMYRMGTDSNKKRLDDWINGVPSAQPEHTCVNCGRTINNGGWYADGGTRCPIESELPENKKALEEYVNWLEERKEE